MTDVDSGQTLQTAAANCETVSTKSAQPAPSSRRLRCPPAHHAPVRPSPECVLQGDVLFHSQGVWHGGQGQYRRGVDQAAFWRPLQS